MNKKKINRSKTLSAPLLVILSVGLSVVLRINQTYSAESAHTFEVRIVKGSWRRFKC